MLLAIAFGFGGQVFVLSAVSAAGVSAAEVGMRPVKADHVKVKAVEEKDAGQAKRQLPVARTNDEEVKRLKMIFMVIMNLGAHRGPAR